LVNERIAREGWKVETYTGDYEEDCAEEFG
jgi:hypothetical protein